MTALMDVLQGAIDIDTNIFLFINGMHNTFFDYFTLCGDKSTKIC